jgi:hypothetical protein
MVSTGTFEQISSIHAEHSLALLQSELASSRGREEALAQRGRELEAALETSGNRAEALAAQTASAHETLAGLQAAHTLDRKLIEESASQRVHQLELQLHACRSVAEDRSAHRLREVESEVGLCASRAPEQPSPLHAW